VHGLEGCKLGVVELPVYLFDFADIDVVHDIAGLRIDKYRATWAFPCHALHCPKQRIAVGPATGFLQRFVDEMHSVVSRERDHVWPKLVRLLECGHVGTVGRGIVGGRIGSCCDHADHLVARRVKSIVIGQIAGPNNLDARVGQTALGELFGENTSLRAGEINKRGVRIDVAYPLQERGKIRIGERDVTSRN
jgi:hypothetical protein